MPSLTVFTPTYNRAYILPKLYDSLCRQLDNDFEWLIVDDGSTDNTRQLIESYISEGRIDIRYVCQANGGKHTAINRGVDLARAPLFMIADSDDYLTYDAVAWIKQASADVMSDDSFGGFSGIRITPDGEKIGGGPAFEPIDSNPIDIRFRHHIRGDLAEVLKTSVMRQFPFPVFDGERFCPEAMVWNRIARRYDMRFFHQGIYVCEYLPDGLTAKITKLRRESPKASMTYYSELFHTQIPFVQKIKAAINFWRFSLAAYKQEYRMCNLLSLLCWLPGKLMQIRDAR